MPSIRPARFALLAGLSLVAGFVVTGGEAHAAAADALQLVQRDGPTLSEAVEQVRRKYRGRIVSAETRMRGNRELHVIKVLTDDGKVITERIRGRTLEGRG
ncbi:MAG: hypothetical protein U5K76_04385 [Woeseiaceae bacterium]|nr:hypothetical protein [Woeseiaceae bacterium]